MPLQCIIVTPERTVCEQEADFVVATLPDGEIGVWPRRAPLIGRLGFGEMRVVSDEETVRYFIEGGFIEALDDVVTVLTGRRSRRPRSTSLWPWNNSTRPGPNRPTRPN